MKTIENQRFEIIAKGDWLGDVNRSAWDRLVEKKGGCRCNICQPCPACSDPVTEEELNHLGYSYGQNHEIQIVSDGIDDGWEEGREV